MCVFTEALFRRVTVSTNGGMVKEIMVPPYYGT